MHTKCVRQKSGFTLIELLVVIAVLGVLAAGVFVAINPLKRIQQARNAQRKMDLGQITNALEAYYTSRGGQYPSTNGSWCGRPGSWWDYTQILNCGDSWIPGLVADGDLKVLPQDPTNKSAAIPCGNDDKSATYLYNSNGADYKLLAHCSPEGDVYLPSDKFYDPSRPNHAWQTSSPGGVSW